MKLLRVEVLFLYKDTYKVVLWFVDENNIQISQEYLGTYEKCKQWLINNM